MLYGRYRNHPHNYFPVVCLYIYIYIYSATFPVRKGQANHSPGPCKGKHAVHTFPSRWTACLLSDTYMSQRQAVLKHNNKTPKAQQKRRPSEEGGASWRRRKALQGISLKFLNSQATMRSHIHGPAMFINSVAK
jgi:hypothetical protein